MKFWKKSEEPQNVEFICVEMNLPAGYAFKLAVLSDKNGYRHELTMNPDDPEMARFEVSLPKDKIDKVLDLCGSKLGSKFM